MNNPVLQNRKGFRSRRAVLAAGASVAVAAAVLAVWLNAAFGTARNDERTPEEHAPAEISAGEELAGEPRSAGASVSAASARTSREGDRGLTLTGIVTLLEPERGPLRSGVLVVAVPEPNGEVSAPRLVDVRKGEFRLHLERNVSELYVFHGDSEGRKLWPAASRHPVDGAQRVVVELTQEPALLVIDAVQGADLDPFLFCKPHQLPPGAVRPSTRTHVGLPVGDVPTERASSPSPASAFSFLGELFVTAEGYTWQRVALANIRSTQTVVSLAPCGYVRVKILGGAEQLAGDTVFRFYQASSDSPDGDGESYMAAYEFGPLGGRADAQGVIEFDKLLPGAYRIEVLRRSKDGHLSALGSANVSVLAGETTLVPLKLAGSVDSPIGEMVIAVVGDVETIQLVDRLVLSPLDRGFARRSEGRRLEAEDAIQNEGYLEWRVAGLWPGRYEMSLEPLMHVAHCDVSGESGQLLVVDLPSLAAISIECIRGGTNVLREIEAYQIISAESDHGALLGLLSSRGRLTAGTNPIQARVVPGAARLVVMLEGFEQRQFTLDTTTQESFVVEIEPARRVVLEIEARGAPLFQPKEWWTRSELRPLEAHAGVAKSLNFDSPLDRSLESGWHSAIEVVCIGPGPFEWTIPSLSGDAVSASTVSFLTADEHVIVNLTRSTYPGH